MLVCNRISCCALARTNVKWEQSLGNMNIRISETLLRCLSVIRLKYISILNCIQNPNHPLQLYKPRVLQFSIQLVLKLTLRTRINHKLNKQAQINQTYIQKQHIHITQNPNSHKKTTKSTHLPLTTEHINRKIKQTKTQNEELSDLRQ